MTALITYTDFVNLRVLANVAQPGDQRDYLTSLIPDMQYQFLQAILGPVLYDEYVVWYMAGQDPANQFYELTYGLVFVHCKRTYNWVGLKKPLIDYVYYKYQEQDATQTVVGGEVKTLSQNANNAPSSYKMMGAWNEMVTYLNAYWQFMDLFYGTTGTVNYSPNVPLYKSPITVQVDTTPGIVNGASSFTFNGTAGTFDWRGYDAYPERIGQGTLIPNVNYTWSSITGVFALLLDTFQPNEYFNFTFSPANPTYTTLVINQNWADYRCQAWEQEVFHLKNRWGL